MEARIFNLNRQKMLKWLESARQKQPAVTIYLKARTSRSDVEKILSRFFDSGELLNTLVEKACESPSGALITYAGGKTWLVCPPFPVEQSGDFKGCQTDILKSMLEKDWKLGLVLVRLGYFAAAVYQGEKLISYKAGTGLVHGRHHKGGSSSQRFARHREKQIETFFTRVENHSREILEPYLKELDHVFYGGTRDTVNKLRRQCSFFQKLESREMERLINVREPKFSELPYAVDQAYSSTVYELSGEN